jgi:uncharacterized protein with PQ loop repeat
MIVRAEGADGFVRITGDAPLIVANAITIVLAGGILVMKLKYG